MGLAGAGSADEHDVLCLRDELAAVEHVLFGDGALYITVAQAVNIVTSRRV